MKSKEISICYRIKEDGIIYKMAFNKDGEIECRKDNSSNRKSGICISNKKGEFHIFQHKGHIFINNHEYDYLQALGFGENQQFERIEIYYRDKKVVFDGDLLCNITNKQLNDSIEDLHVRIFFNNEAPNYKKKIKELEEKHIFL